MLRKNKKAYAILRIIRRNFIYLSEKVFVSLHNALVSSHLEYANSAWNLCRMGLIKNMQKVHTRATKLVIFINHLR